MNNSEPVPLERSKVSNIEASQTRHFRQVTRQKINIRHSGRREPSSSGSQTPHNRSSLQSRFERVLFGEEKTCECDHDMQKVCKDEEKSFCQCEDSLPDTSFKMNVPRFSRGPKNDGQSRGVPKPAITMNSKAIPKLGRPAQNRDASFSRGEEDSMSISLKEIQTVGTVQSIRGVSTSQHRDRHRSIVETPSPISRKSSNTFVRYTNFFTLAEGWPKNLLFTRSQSVVTQSFSSTNDAPTGQGGSEQAVVSLHDPPRHSTSTGFNWVHFAFLVALGWLAYLTYLAINGTGGRGSKTRSAEDIYGKYDGPLA